MKNELPEDDGGVTESPPVEDTPTKRPPGAGWLTREIYKLVSANPGATTDDLLGKIEPGWVDHRTYVRYHRYLEHESRQRAEKAGREWKPTPFDPKPAFTTKAIRWRIGRKANSMRAGGALKGSPKGWHPGTPPTTILNVAENNAFNESVQATHVRREEVKAELMKALNADPPARWRKPLQVAYDHLCHRDIPGN